MREGRIMTIDHFPVRPLPLSQACQLTRGTGPGALAPAGSSTGLVPARDRSSPSKVERVNGHSPLASVCPAGEDESRDSARGRPTEASTVLGTRYLGRDMSPTALCANLAGEMMPTSPSQVPCTCFFAA